MTTAPQYGYDFDPDRSEQIRQRARETANPRLIKRELVAYGAELGALNSAQRAANRARMEATHARQDADRRRIARLEALRWITADFPSYAAAEVEDPEVAGWLADSAAGGTDWLVLLGPTGVGKTWQAVAAYRVLADDLGCDGYAVRALSLLARAMPSEPDRLPWHLLEDADLLLLDDVPGGLSEWDRRTLLRIIDARQGTGRRTIVTTNLRRGQVRDQLGDQLASRLSQGTRVVSMAGPDRRRGHAEG